MFRSSRKDVLRGLLGHSCLMGLVIAGMAGAANAQSAAPVAAEDESAADQNAIVVTARRSQEKLQDVPLSINALSADDLTKRGSTDLQDVANYTPGLRFTDFLSKFNGNATIRGLSPTNVQDAIGNTGVFLDGIYLQRGYMVDSQLGDLERIEIVKGPQSALYGQNTFSGAINYVLRQPSDHLRINGQASVGNGGYRDLRLGVGGPIIPDLLFGRVYDATANFDGVWKNNWPGAQNTDLANYGGYKRENFSASLKATPMDGLTITGSYYRLNRREKIRAFYTIDGNLKEDTLNCGAKAANGSNYLWCGNLPSSPDGKHTGLNSANYPSGLFTVPQPGMQAKTEVYHASVEYKFANVFTFNYDYGNVRGEGLEQSAFTSNSYLLTTDSYKATGVSPSISLQREAGLLKYQSHDARLAFDNGGPFNFDFGYFHSKAWDNFIFGLTLNFPSATKYPNGGNIPVLVGGSTDVLAIGSALPGFIPFTEKLNQYWVDSGYGRASLKLLDNKLTLAAEGRYTHTKLSTIDYLSGNLTPLEASYNNFTPRFTAQYEFGPRNMLYVSAAKGAKAGGFNGRVAGSGSTQLTLLPSEQSYGEEVNWTYEIGDKGSLFDNKLDFAITAFYVDWQKRQIGAPPSNYVPPTSTVQGQAVPGITISGGAARSYGIELTTAYRITPDFDVNGSFSWQHATAAAGAVSPSTSSVCDDIVCNKSGVVTGNFLGNVPWLQGSVGVNYHHEIKDGVVLFAGLDEVYRGKMYTDPSNTASIAPYALTNGRLGLETKLWKAFFWGRNLFDHQYAEASFVVPSILQYNVNLGDLRTFGFTFSVNY